MIFSSIALLMPPLASIWTASNLLEVCHGFTTPTHHRPTKSSFSLKLPPLRFKEDDTLVTTAPMDLMTTMPMDFLLQGKVVLEDGATAVDLLQIEEAAVALPKKKTGLFALFRRR